MSENTLFRVSLHTEADLAAVLEEALPAAGYPVSLWTNAEETDCRLDYFCEDNLQALDACEAIRKLALDLARGESVRMSCEPIPREEWAESWKRFFHAERVSDRVIVRPSWETLPLGPGDREVVIDAGMCFGTGQHGTTRACIRFLDARAAAAGAGRLLDAGCGSGILSIAAVKLGYGPVTAIDLDADAVDQARDNAASNGVADAIRLEAADVLAWTPDAPFETVAANIEAPILVAAADRLAGVLCSPRPGSALLLAGILERQYGEVAAAFASRGFTERRQMTLDGWTSGWWERA